MSDNNEFNALLDNDNSEFNALLDNDNSEFNALLDIEEKVGLLDELYDPDPCQACIRSGLSVPNPNCDLCVHFVRSDPDRFFPIGEYETEELIELLSSDKSALYGVCEACDTVVRFPGRLEGVCCLCGGDMIFYHWFDDLSDYLRARDGR